MPPNVPNPQLAAALKELDSLVSQGEAEFKKRPEQFQQVKNLAAELKKLKPGQTPPAKMMEMLKSFLGQQLDEEIKDQTKLLADAQRQSGPAIVPIAAAHRATLDALSAARQGLGSLSVNAPPSLVESTGVRVTNLTNAAEKAVGAAEAKAFAPKPKPAAPPPKRK